MPLKKDCSRSSMDLFYLYFIVAVQMETAEMGNNGRI